MIIHKKLKNQKMKKKINNKQIKKFFSSFLYQWIEENKTNGLSFQMKSFYSFSINLILQTD